MCTSKSSIRSSGSRWQISLMIEKTASVWWIVAGNTCKLRDHSVFSAFGIPGSLNYWKHWVSPRLCYKQPVPVTSSSWKLQVSYWQRSTSPDSTFERCSPSLCPSTRQSMHLAAAHENSTLRRILNFFTSCFRASPYLRVSRILWCSRTFRGWGTCRNMRRQIRRCRIRFRHTSFFSFLLLHPFRHRVGAAYQTGILSATSGAEMADVGQMKKIVPFVTCEVAFGQNVCQLMFGFFVSNLNFGIKTNSVKQPIQNNSVDSWHRSHCGTSVFY